MLGKILSKLEEKFGGLTPFVVVAIVSVISFTVWGLIYMKVPVKMSNERDKAELYQVIQEEWSGDTLINHKVYPQMIWVIDTTGEEKDVVSVYYERIKGADTISCVSFVSVKPRFLKWRVGDVIKTGENIKVIETEVGISFTNELNWIDDYKKKLGM